ncbi:MAG: hypothetical protein CMB80_12285 [Flammeovirgaceae bacterium]|nr:hypothetical protein [Flammeovirgaceae bacterium]|tara:strand:+ start:58 stop:429 length:372 start_codon:yes stop_codon:yes gene_type:complete
MTLITLKIELPPQDINDILCTAIEGGINYWCDQYEVLNDDNQKVDYAWEVIGFSDKAQLVFFENESDADTAPTMTRISFLIGLQKWLDSKEWIWPFSIDTGDIDAGDADCIVQYALFGELKYC